MSRSRAGTLRIAILGIVALAAAVVSVPLLVDLLGDGAADPAFAQVGAESARAVCLVCDHVVGAATRSAGAETRDADAFQQRSRTDTVVALAGSEQEGQGSAAAVAGEMDLGGQTSTGSTKGLIVRFVRPTYPPFRPVVAACESAVRSRSCMLRASSPTSRSIETRSCPAWRRSRSTSAHRWMLAR